MESLRPNNKKQKLLPAEWYNEMQELGVFIERQAKILQAELHPSDIATE